MKHRPVLALVPTERVGAGKSGLPIKSPMSHNCDPHTVYANGDIHELPVLTALWCSKV